MTWLFFVLHQFNHFGFKGYTVAELIGGFIYYLYNQCLSFVITESYNSNIDNIVNKSETDQITILYKSTLQYYYNFDLAEFRVR